MPISGSGNFRSGILGLVPRYFRSTAVRPGIIPDKFFGLSGYFGTGYFLTLHFRSRQFRIFGKAVSGEISGYEWFLIELQWILRVK